MANSRRDFVKVAAGAGLAAGLSSAKERGEIPKRRLGKTGLDVSILGLGGARTGNVLDQKQAIDTIRRCYDLGVNYFDTAAAGAYGISQKRYGLALADVRDKIFIGTKTRHRSRTQSQLDLNQSLSNMKTDHLDLYQVHNVINDEDIEFIFGPNGVMEMIEKAKKEGKIRFIGVTGHTNPHILTKIINLYDFDTVLMPLSVTDGARRDYSFEHFTLPVALEKNMGVIAMKVTGVGALMQEGVASLDDCLNYVWSLPASTAILGCETVAEVEADAKLATQSRKLTSAQMDEMRKKHAEVDFARLESWKVKPEQKTAAGRRYVGD